ncbi:ThuA domain-containing protein [Chitinophagaceae bacterium LB-8]|uniref:ThuA domain-containing protein n=1 Tax=Paraflavisolibacter caeni TaxID=2982496 RepID=A0A9X2XPY5_9BACT|nr:ThuA domain-containing protein [Paraflavisolibacter caeni]MCU7552508.1 ThuA domain-containing protein [Paraflavisolibacter caeni]
MNKNSSPLKSIILCAVMFIVLTACGKSAPKPRVLVFCKTAGFYHESIPDGIAAISRLGSKNNFEVDTTTDSTFFTSANLKKYAAVIFLSTTGNVLSSDGEKAFEQYIRSGGGYVGVHSATDTEYDWPWYGKLAGAYFLNHPEQQEAVLKKTSVKHISTDHLPDEWKRKDEWYNFKNLNNEVTVLLTIDEKSYKGGKNGDFHPVSWFHQFEGGRAFYTALGHTKESYSEENFLKHLLGGILYAIGNTHL